jgi:hypothetical protein
MRLRKNQRKFRRHHPDAIVVGVLALAASTHRAAVRSHDEVALQWFWSNSGGAGRWMTGLRSDAKSSTSASMSLTFHGRRYGRVHGAFWGLRDREWAADWTPAEAASP